MGKRFTLTVQEDIEGDVYYEIRDEMWGHVVTREGDRAYAFSVRDRLEESLGWGE